MIVTALAPPCIAVIFLLIQLQRMSIADFVVIAWAGFVFVVSSVAYLHRKKPAMLVAAMCSGLFLLVWAMIVFIR